MHNLAICLVSSALAFIEQYRVNQSLLKHKQDTTFSTRKSELALLRGRASDQDVLESTLAAFGSWEGMAVERCQVPQPASLPHPFRFLKLYTG